MIFFICVLAGAIGGSIAGGLAPNRSFSGSMNVGYGIFGGTLSWTVATDIGAMDPHVSNFLLILIIAGTGGIILTLGAASLRNIIRTAR